jgi:hypothetical protein
MGYLKAALILFVLIPLSVYSQSNTLKFDLKYEIISNDYFTVNDTLNHKIGKAAGTGSVIFSDGTQGIMKVCFIYDYTGGNGDFTEYYNITLTDGSELTVQAKGQSLGSKTDYSPIFTGKVTITGGSGIYEGRNGDGTVTGNRNESLTEGAIVKLSFTINTK